MVEKRQRTGVGFLVTLFFVFLFTFAYCCRAKREMREQKRKCAKSHSIFNVFLIE